LNKHLLLSLMVTLTIASTIVAGCATTTNTTPSPTAAPTVTTKPSADSSAYTSTITIKNFTFQPPEVTVEKGTLVTWVNEDSVGHTVTSNDGKFSSSGSFSKGDSYQVQFNDPGTYTYHCAPHPFMKGTIIVEQ
jgi:amicyanin